MKWQTLTGWLITYRELDLNNFNRIGYIHIPKTAGRTIRLTLSEYGLNLPPKPRGRPVKGQKNTVHFLLNEHNKEDFDFFFSTIRNPIDWLQSYYYFAGFHAPRIKVEPTIKKFETFDNFIEGKGYNILKERFGVLTQSEWVEGIPVQNLLRVESLQEDLDMFCEDHNLVKVKIKSTGVNKSRNRRTKPKVITIERIMKAFKPDFELIKKINQYRDVKNSIEVVYD